MKQQTKKQNTNKKEKCIEKLRSLERIVINLNGDNYEETIASLYILLGIKYYNTQFNIVSQLIYILFLSRNIDFEVCIMFLELLQVKTISEYDIIPIFTRFLLSLDSQESNYLLELMRGEEIVGDHMLIYRDSIYFIHCMKSYDIQKVKHNFLYYDFQKNSEVLSKNHFALHKKLMKEGVNPNEIAKIIRNDEIEKLQEKSSQTNFDFNQKIEPSLYERCSFINHENVTLIDYAAFFGSVKCFKHLLMNGANVENTGKYAVAGGNEEIIHLCEQNHSTFKGAYEAAIKYHQNDIFKYIYENKIVSVLNLDNLISGCIFCNSYEILSYLMEKEGLNITDLPIDKLASTGNLYIIKCFPDNFQFPSDILFCCSSSGNVDLAKYILKHKNNSNIDINAEYVYIFYLRFVFINWY